MISDILFLFTCFILVSVIMLGIIGQHKERKHSHQRLVIQAAYNAFYHH